MKKQFKHTLAIAFIAIMLCVPIIVIAEEFHIPDDFDTIQEGVNAAENGDVVIVAPGEYNENIDYTGKSIAIIGDPERPEDVVITGGRNGRSVVVFRDVDETATLSGFTITNGQSDYGGGIYCNNANVSLSHLIITENALSDNGGGLYCTHNSTVEITDSIIRDNQADSGGGISCYFASTVTISDCIIEGNIAQSYGGGLQCSRGESVMFVTNSRVAFNHANVFGGGLFSYGSGGEVPEFTLSNVEFVGNTCNRDGGGICTYDAIGVLERVVMYDNNCSAIVGYDAQLDVRNCTFYNNQAGANREIIYSAGRLDFTNSIFVNEGDELIRASGGGDFSYNDILGGRNSVLGNVGWLDGNIDEDPLFVDPDNGDLHLTGDSPCINAGDPDGERDIDGTVADMGAYTYLFTTVVFGNVRDAANLQPLENVTVAISNGIETNTDEQGDFNVLSWAGVFDVTFSLPGYNDFVAEAINFPFLEEVEVNADLLHPEFVCSPEDMEVSVDSAMSANQLISISNPGNGTLRWSLEYHFDGEEDVPPWELRRSIPVGQITDDSRVEGIVFTGEHFVVHGRGVDVATIYVLDLDGEIVNSFPTPRDNDNRTISNLTWDGELIWASGSGTIYGFTLDGEVIQQWEGPFDVNTRLAYDSERDVLWIGYTTEDIVAYSRDGQRRGVIRRSGLRISALAYYGDDIDGCNLYIAHTMPDSSHTTISKVNPDVGEFQMVHDFANREDANYKGCFLTREYDRFNGWVLMAVSNSSDDDGGDRIDIFQLQRNIFFVMPDVAEGEIAAESQQPISIDFNTVNDEGFVLPISEYAGELVFTHNALGGQIIVPLTLNVEIPSIIARKPHIMPLKAELSSAYPNPFNSTTTIGYSLPVAGRVSLAVYDLAGREVARLMDGVMSAGTHEAVWQADGIASGVYVVKLVAGEKTAMRKVALVK